MLFRPASLQRQDTRLRMALTGPEGSGKTWLTLALGEAIARFEGGEMAMLDSERGKSSLYSDFFNFQVGTLTDYSPQSYIDAIKAAERAGFPVIGIDSLTHAWRWLLNYVERIGKRNTFNAWESATPLQDDLIAAMIDSPSHIICTMRVKTAYVQERNSEGKTVVRKVGLKPIQRDGVGYEFDLIGSLDSTHTLTITKSRFPSLDGRQIVRPGRELADTVMQAMLPGAAATSDDEAAGDTPKPRACTRDGCGKVWMDDDSFPSRTGSVSGKRVYEMSLEDNGGALCYQHLIALMRGSAGR